MQVRAFEVEVHSTEAIEGGFSDDFSGSPAVINECSEITILPSGLICIYTADPSIC